ncbi:hypothetical protein BKA69DRAFT_576641 [Paraphysoderma sedebokerense]|nr:hypothetical protein BKA69DRAFT_576641 [Paraphysoderma sedebokerense]
MNRTPKKSTSYGARTPPSSGSTKPLPCPKAPKIFASYLPPHYTMDDVTELFGECGQIVSVKLLPTPNASLLPLKYRCGFVQFELPESVDKAISEFNLKHIVEDGKRYVLTVRNANDQAPMNTTNLMIKNIAHSVDEKRLRDEFTSFGEVTSVRIMRDSHSLAFVNFLNSSDALRAIQQMHNAHLDGRRIHVSFAEKEYPYNVHVFDNDADSAPLTRSRSGTTSSTGTVTSYSATSRSSLSQDHIAERDFHHDDPLSPVSNASHGMMSGFGMGIGEHYEMADMYGRSLNPFMPNQEDYENRTNVYIRNLSMSIGDERLKREFERFGVVTSCKVMRHTNGVSKRIAFVNFLHPSSALKAIQSTIFIDGRQVYASYAYNRFSGKEDVYTSPAPPDLSLSMLPQKTNRQMMMADKTPLRGGDNMNRHPGPSGMGLPSPITSPSQSPAPSPTPSPYPPSSHIYHASSHSMLNIASSVALGNSQMQSQMGASTSHGSSAHHGFSGYGLTSPSKVTPVTSSPLTRSSPTVSGHVYRGHSEHEMPLREFQELNLDGRSTPSERDFPMFRDLLNLVSE